MFPPATAPLEREAGALTGASLEKLLAPSPPSRRRRSCRPYFTSFSTRRCSSSRARISLRNSRISAVIARRRLIASIDRNPRAVRLVYNFSTTGNRQTIMGTGRAELVDLRVPRHLRRALREVWMVRLLQ